MYKFEIIDINEDQPLFSSEFTTEREPEFDLVDDTLVGYNHNIVDFYSLLNAVEVFLSYHPNAEELILSVTEDEEVLADVEAGEMSVLAFLNKVEGLMYEPLCDE